MSFIGSTPDVSITSSLLRNESTRKQPSRFTLGELAVLSGSTFPSSSQNYPEPHLLDPFKDAKKLLHTIRLKKSKEQTDDPQNECDSADEVLKLVRKKGRKKPRNKEQAQDAEQRHKDSETQTDMEIEEVIKELEELDKLSAIVSGDRHSYRKSMSHVNQDPDIKIADDLLQELDSAIFRNTCTQTDYLSNKKIFQETIDFPLPRRAVQSKIDHRWPKGHKLHLKFCFDKKIRAKDV
ncbi:uncharacterized protein LOC128183087 isoform X2 [Crassostrea angulata]|uniref:uncharacterized protein LOC128183087 isoform X2 n=1 Tax=Magallana angulata TaxID=2784310 RepID=UPI0022B1C220|nr:uncharacterized protein LOC128183087 isoform X2 [Crassostrea angulata]